MNELKVCAVYSIYHAEGHKVGDFVFGAKIARIDSSQEVVGERILDDFSARQEYAPGYRGYDADGNLLFVLCQNTIAYYKVKP